MTETVDLDETILEEAQVDLDETIAEILHPVTSKPPDTSKLSVTSKPPINTTKNSKPATPLQKKQETPLAPTSTAPPLPTDPVVVPTLPFDEDGAPKNEEGGESSTDESSSEDEMYSGLTEEQKRVMKAKFADMQVGYQVAMKKQQSVKVNEVKNMLEFWCDTTIADDLAEFILEFTTRHDMNFRQRVEMDGQMFLEMMMEMHADQKKKCAQEAKREKKDSHYNPTDDPEPASEDDSGGEELSEEFDPNQENWINDAKKRKAIHKKKREKMRVAKGIKMNGQKRVGRLLLDEALKDKNSMEGWSEARKKAFKNIKSNPNAYYYRFNAVGEKQGNGGFTDEEHKIFMTRLRELGANNKWGIFSMKVPGRVGYQCSNYYRDLVKKKIILDPNYHWDGKKLHFKRGSKVGKDKKLFEAQRFFNFTIKHDKSGVWEKNSRHPKAPPLSAEDLINHAGNDSSKSGASGSEASKSKRKRPNKAKRRTKKHKAEKEDDISFTVRQTEVADENANPIPDFIDPIDGNPVQVPAISPYGHVCGYANWTKMLRQENSKNTCPFTKQPLGRRDLVKLTKANYSQYKDKIINRPDA